MHVTSAHGGSAALNSRCAASRAAIAGSAAAALPPSAIAIRIARIGNHRSALARTMLVAWSEVAMPGKLAVVLCGMCALARADGYREHDDNFRGGAFDWRGSDPRL